MRTRPGAAGGGRLPVPITPGAQAGGRLLGLTEGRSSWLRGLEVSCRGLEGCLQRKPVRFKPWGNPAPADVPHPIKWVMAEEGLAKSSLSLLPLW